MLLKAVLANCSFLFSFLGSLRRATRRVKSFAHVKGSRDLAWKEDDVLEVDGADASDVYKCRRRILALTWRMSKRKPSCRSIARSVIAEAVDASSPVHGSFVRDRLPHASASEHRACVRGALPPGRPVAAVCRARVSRLAFSGIASGSTYGLETTPCRKSASHKTDAALVFLF